MFPKSLKMDRLLPQKQVHLCTQHQKCGTKMKDMILNVMCGLLALLCMSYVVYRFHLKPIAYFS